MIGYDDEKIQFAVRADKICVLADVGCKGRKYFFPARPFMEVDHRIKVL